MPVVPIILGAIVFFVLASSVGGYLYGWRWTGVSSRTHPNRDDEEISPGKTLWDWMQLLMVPAGLALVALLFNDLQESRQRALENSRIEAERAVTIDNQREQALQGYFDDMTELMLDRHLQTSPREEVRAVGRIRTLTILRRLDAKRKAIVVRFLYDARLIDAGDVVLGTAGANLGGATLDFANLGGVNLSRANLSRANFFAADLSGANLSRSNLVEADLSVTKLRDAHLVQANFFKAVLQPVNSRGANFRNAFLGRADLRQASLSGANLCRAKFLRGGSPRGEPPQREPPQRVPPRC